MDLGNGEIHQEQNWECPLLGGAKICETCCEVELAGGMGAPDTLRETARKTGKSPAEIHAICVGCVHGGPELEEPHKLIAMRGSDGKMHKSGPEFEAHDREFREAWAEQLNQLKNAR
jgi:hypothetical protein